MKKYIFLAPIVLTMLTGCDKLSEVIDRIKGGSSWEYSEDIDKLNNTKIFKAKKEYKNSEKTVQADLEFQCGSGKSLTLEIATYETRQVNGKFPGVTLKFQPVNAKSGDFSKTRNGEQKIAFPVLSDKDFDNIAKLSLTGIGMTGFSGQLGGLMLMAQFLEAGIILNSQGYDLALEGKNIPKLFKTKDWIIEIPTENGAIVAEIDLSNKNIQKVFEACSWKPEFMNSIAVVPAAPTAVSQPQAPSQPVASPALEQKANPQDDCVSKWVNAYRTEKNDQEAIVSADMLSEWDEWCKNGKLP